MSEITHSKETIALLKAQAAVAGGEDKAYLQYRLLSPPPTDVCSGRSDEEVYSRLQIIIKEQMGGVFEEEHYVSYLNRSYTRGFKQRIERESTIRGLAVCFEAIVERQHLFVYENAQLDPATFANLGLTRLENLLQETITSDEEEQVLQYHGRLTDLLNCLPSQQKEVKNAATARFANIITKNLQPQLSKEFDQDRSTNFSPEKFEQHFSYMWKQESGNFREGAYYILYKLAAREPAFSGLDLEELLPGLKKYKVEIAELTTQAGQLAEQERAYALRLRDGDLKYLGDETPEKLRAVCQAEQVHSNTIRRALEISSKVLEFDTYLAVHFSDGRLNSRNFGSQKFSIYEQVANTLPFSKAPLLEELKGLDNAVIWMKNAIKTSRYGSMYSGFFTLYPNFQPDDQEGIELAQRTKTSFEPLYTRVNNIQPLFKNGAAGI